MKKNSKQKYYYNVSKHGLLAKFLISAFLGILCLFFSKFGIAITIGNISIDVPWSIVFALIAALSYGPLFGFISALFGGALYPFLLWGNNGWANILNFILLTLFFIGIGSVNKIEIVKGKYTLYKRLIIVLFFFLIIMSFSYRYLFNWFLQFNPSFWSKNSINSIDVEILDLFILKDAVNFVILTIISEIFLCIPNVRKLLGLDVPAETKLNTKIILSATVASLLIWSVFTLLEIRLVGNINSIHKDHFNLNLFVLITGGLFAARVIIHFVINQFYTEFELIESEEKFRAITEQTESLISLTDTNGIVTYASPSANNLFGYEPIEMCGKRFTEFVDEAGISIAENAFKNTIENGISIRNIEVKLKRKDGSMFFGEVNGSNFKIENENGCLVIIQDITERKLTEQALSESSAMLNMILDTVPQSIFWKDLNGRYLGCNSIFARAIGVATPKEVIGKTDYDMPWSKQEADAYRADDKEVIDNIRPKLHIIEPLQQADGIRLWIDTSKVPLIDKFGKPFAVLGVYQDITERRLAEETLNNYRNHLEALVKERTEELEKANESLTKVIEKEKELSQMKSRFISTTSHEFRTPLTAILSSTELIQRFNDKWDVNKKNEHFKRIQNSVEYLTVLLDDILTLNRAESGMISFNPEIVDLHKFADECLLDSRIISNENHSVKFSYLSGQKDFLLDPKLMRFVLNNLLSNAIKYSPDGGIIELKISSDKEFLLIEVVDEGIGIPKEDLNKIFDSFYRTKHVEGIAGTGLGLAIVKRAVNLHNGEILVTSEIGKGTTFTVKIPISKTA